MREGLVERGKKKGGVIRGEVMEKQLLVMVQKQIWMENILVPYGYLLLFLNEALSLMESDAQAVDTWQ